MLAYNPGKECGTCENCWMRKVDIPGDGYLAKNVKFIYDVYCNVDDKSLGGLHNSKAELCRNYIERKGVDYGH